ncbi:MAG: DMT family transporter [Pseudomonadota bacterium]
MTPASRPAPVAVAILTVMSGIFLLDIMGVFIRILSDTYPALQLSAMRNLFGLIPTLLLLWTVSDWHARGRPLIIRRWRLALLRGAFVIGAQIGFYTALSKLEFATVSTLAFVSPMIVTALSVPVLGAHVGPWRWAAVAIGFLGVVAIVRPGTDAFTIWALLPLGAALGYASASVAVRLFDDDVPSPLVNAYSTGSALVLATLLTFALAEPVWIQSWRDLGLIIAMGLCGGSGVLCLTIGYRMASPPTLAPFEYTGILFAFAIGWIVFDEAPFNTLFPGVLLIIGAGLLIVWRERLARSTVPHPRAKDRLR